MTKPGSMTKEQITEAFEQEQRDDRYENGHSYSGGFGMASGIKFLAQAFPTVTEAEEYVCDNAQKWEEALCAKVTEGDLWFIGAWCSS